MLLQLMIGKAAAVNSRLRTSRVPVVMASLDAFDDCLVRISCLGIGATQLCAGLNLSAGDEPIYFPFGAIRGSGVPL